MERIEKLLEFLKGAPNDSFLQHALALEYVKQGDYTRAIDLFRTVLARDPNYIGSYYHLGAALEAAGNRQEALAVYQTGMEKSLGAGDRHAWNELQNAWEELSDV